MRPAIPHPHPRPVLRARRSAWRYRTCPRCGRECPADRPACPDCQCPLAGPGLERAEWQLVPDGRYRRAGGDYRFTVAGVLVLRLSAPTAPGARILAALAELIHDGDLARAGVVPVPRYGWLVGLDADPRRAFLRVCAAEPWLRALPGRAAALLPPGAGLRWGVFVDQFILPFGRGGAAPALPAPTAAALFDVEPAGRALVSPPLYAANRQWEEFVWLPAGAPGAGGEAYRWVGHKRASALDHAAAWRATPFIGREAELAALERCFSARGRLRCIAISARAGSGKTRLIREWLARHPRRRAAVANFSLFGGDVESFAAQLGVAPAASGAARPLAALVLARLRQQRTGIVVLDDLHWAGAAGRHFVARLLEGLRRRRAMVIVAARPEARDLLESLRPAQVLDLQPLAAADASELAARLIADPRSAAAAAARAAGNPLFVEQFAAWAAESGYDGGADGPRSLHEVVAARIAHLSQVRIEELRRLLRTGRGREGPQVSQALAALEAEVGLWLDRLETGDYVDRRDAARQLVHLEQLDYGIFLVSALAGQPRVRSSRLRESMERLVLASAEEILASLRERAARGGAAEREAVREEAGRAGEVLADHYQWRQAREFFALAAGLAPPGAAHGPTARLEECASHMQGHIADDAAVWQRAARCRIVARPAVSALELPYAWIALGRRSRRPADFAAAAAAALAINDPALATWARQQAGRAGGGRATPRTTGQAVAAARLEGA